eukprot:TRINITY_DN11143_c0_g1_i1.p1 TRINITY_DN11143_c0_g1~~TRINITY_DN11143_c0_g1_i1.p1  ORF type:complete len:174 (-),score=49.28 TRINITY_DN11143_c0_g1_i1:66-587(-)
MDPLKQMLSDSNNQLSSLKSRKPLNINYPNVEEYKWKMDNNLSNMIDSAFIELSEYLHRLANEPSLGIYHINVHIRKAIPRMENTTKEMNTIIQKTDNANYDIEDSEGVIIGMSESKTFDNILDLINSSAKTLQAIKRREKYVPKITNKVENKEIKNEEENKSDDKDLSLKNF